MNIYIENKQPNIDYKYKLNSFITYDFVKQEFVSYLKLDNNWVIMDKNNSRSVDIKFLSGINYPKLLFYERV